MLILTLAISCLTISNLPCFMDLTFQVPMQYFSLSIRLYFHQQSHPQLSVVFLWLCLFSLSGVISPLISSSILGTYQPGEFIFWCPIFLPFRTVHEVLKARILKWFSLPFFILYSITDNLFMYFKPFQSYPPEVDSIVILIL